MKIIFFGFIFRIFLSIINIYFITLPGGEYDAVAFHLKGIDFKNFLEDGNSFFDYKYTFGWIYSIFLGYVYYLFGSSELLGSILSCTTWLISCLVLREIMIKFNFGHKYIFYSLIFYTFLFPSSLVYTALTLRESYLLLFSNLLFLFLTQISLQSDYKIKILNLLFFVIISFLLINFHVAGIIYIGSLYLLLIVFLISSKLNLNSTKTNFILILLLPLFILTLEHFGIFKEIFNKINSYQSGHYERYVYFRAHYYEKNEIIMRDYSFFNLFLMIFKNNLNYFFQPSIFNLLNYKDLIIILENYFRFIFLIIIFYKMFLKFKNKNLYFILLMMFLIMESIYAQATVNYGTASRHHVTSLGYLILLVFFPVKKI